MILTLIGMSGAGKTFWATKLAAHGFTCFSCDALLGARLQAICGVAGTSLVEIGRWMGLPHQDGFQRREALYLACEADVLREVIEHAAQSASATTNCVIDTGGSAIYADAKLFQQLRRFSTIVYLTIPASMHQQMLATYLDRPLPLIWNGLFKPEPNENLQETFARCYPQLIRYREQLYQRYSDVALEYSYHHRPELSAASLLRYIQANARSAQD